MKSLTVEISWDGLINYDEEDIRLALVKKFKSCNFSVNKIMPEVQHDWQESIMLDIDKLPKDKTTFSVQYKDVH